MKRRILVRPVAARDLDQYTVYIAENSSVRAALRFHAAVRQTLRMIAKQPAMGVVRPLRNPFLAGVRMCVVKGFPSHLVFYRMAPNAVEILRIVHGARDLEALIVTDD